MPEYRLELAVAGRDLPEQAELIAYAEARGLTGVWVSEVNGADAITQAASAVSVSSKMRVGTAIIPTQTRDPLLTAMTAHSLSELSGGRFILGVGTSTSVIVEDWHGRSWGKPLAGTREFVSLVRQLMAGDRVTAEGPFPMKRASLARRGQQSVPIYLGALNDGMLRLAAEIADGVILNFISPPQVQRAVELIRSVRKEAALDGPFEVAVFFRATVTDDVALALPRYQQELLTYLMSPVYQKFFAADDWGALCESTAQLWKAGEREAALAGISAEFIQQRVLVGTAPHIKQQLESYAEAGMDTAFILPVPPAGADYFPGSKAIIDALAK